MTDYALEILRKHEQRVAKEKQSMEMGKLQRHIEEAKREAYNAKKIAASFGYPGTSQMTLDLQDDNEKSIIEPDVPCDASDEDLIAFNDNVLKIGG